MFRVVHNGAGTLEQIGQPVDRRAYRRIAAHWIFRLARSNEKAVDARTVNISSAGFCCHCTEPFSPGEILLALLEIPGLSADRQLETLVLRCQAVVLRAEILAESSQWRIAGRILDYSVLSTGRATSGALLIDEQ